MKRVVKVSRRGMSLVELLVGMLMLAIIGMSMTKIMLSQARYYSHQKVSNAARNVSRGPLNRVVSDLRMVEARGGVVFASDTAIEMRVPYSMGIVCGTSGGTHISMLPADSAMVAAPGYTGYAWRGGNGVYRYKESSHVKDVGTLSVCNANSVLTLTTQGAKVVRISPALPDTASVGTPVFLYRKIRYAFRNSAALPGTKGLFRTVVSAGTTEELSAPYDATAKFRFFVASSTTAQAAAPSNLATLRGIEMQMPGMSEKIAKGSTGRYKSPFNTAIFFKNRLD